MQNALGWNGPNGFTPYPGEAATNLSYAEWLHWMEANVRPAQIREAKQDPRLAERFAMGQQAVDKAFGAATLLQQADRAFTRAEVLLILKAIKADTGVVAGKEALERAIRTFTALE